jgi:hypothetical protein
VMVTALLLALIERQYRLSVDRPAPTAARQAAA